MSTKTYVKDRLSLRNRIIRLVEAIEHEWQIAGSPHPPQEFTTPRVEAIRKAFRRLWDLY